MTVEDRLYEMFSDRLESLEDEIDLRISPRWRSAKMLQEEWSEFLSRVPGLEKMGKILGMVLDGDEGHVRIRDPLVFGGNQGFLSIPRESAMKMIALGHIPQED